MTATFTVDVFSSLDGYGTHNGDWGAYWGKEGPEFLAHRLAQYGEEQRMVFGATTFREYAELLTSNPEPPGDDWATRMWNLPATVISATLQDTLGRPAATIERGDAAEVVARLKEESAVPLRSNGSLSLSRALLAAGLVDRLQVTIFPVITGRTGTDPIYRGAADFDLELISTRTFDKNTQELTYHPTPHT
jgi:dihydrofolate reductase